MVGTAAAVAVVSTVAAVAVVSTVAVVAVVSTAVVAVGIMGEQRPAQVMEAVPMVPPSWDKRDVMPIADLDHLNNLRRRRWKYDDVGQAPFHHVAVAFVHQGFVAVVQDVIGPHNRDQVGKHGRIDSGGGMNGRSRDHEKVSFAECPVDDPPGNARTIIDDSLPGREWQWVVFEKPCERGRYWASAIEARRRPGAVRSSDPMTSAGGSASGPEGCGTI